MSVVMITASLKEESVPKVDAAIERLFAAIDREQPARDPLRVDPAPHGVTAMILPQVTTMSRTRYLPSRSLGGLESQCK